MTIGRCYSSNELLSYWQGDVSAKEKENTELHLYGKKVGKEMDKLLGVEVDKHNNKGCFKCLDELTKINVDLSENVVGVLK